MAVRHRKYRDGKTIGEEVVECTRWEYLFTERALQKAFFSYGSGIPKRTLARFEWRNYT